MRYDAASEEPDETITPEEFAEARRFIATQRTMMESMADWMPFAETP